MLVSTRHPSSQPLLKCLQGALPPRQLLIDQRELQGQASSTRKLRGIAELSKINIFL